MYLLQQVFDLPFQLPLEKPAPQARGGGDSDSSLGTRVHVERPPGTRGDTMIPIG